MIPNMSDYAAKKAKGLITIQKISDENFAIHIKQFSPVDGSALDDVVQGITMSEVNDICTIKTAELDAVETLRIDLGDTK